MSYRIITEPGKSPEVWQTDERGDPLELAYTAFDQADAELWIRDQGEKPVTVDPNKPDFRDDFDGEDLGGVPPARKPTPQPAKRGITISYGVALAVCRVLNSSDAYPPMLQDMIEQANEEFNGVEFFMKEDESVDCRVPDFEELSLDPHTED